MVLTCYMTYCNTNDHNVTFFSSTCIVISYVFRGILGFCSHVGEGDGRRCSKLVYVYFHDIACWVVFSGSCDYERLDDHASSVAIHAVGLKW